MLVYFLFKKTKQTCTVTWCDQVKLEMYKNMPRVTLMPEPNRHIESARNIFSQASRIYR